MKTENLKVNQLSPPAYEWYLGYLEAIDSKDIQKYGAYLADNCVMYQNNNEPVEGKATILQEIVRTEYSIPSLFLDISSLDPVFFKQLGRSLVIH